MMLQTTRGFLVPALASTGAMAVVWLPPVSGQSPAPAAKTPAKTWTLPKTLWGDPDLQGLWPATDMINVPMQRPANFGTRAVLTPEEYAVREQAAQRTAAADKVEYVAEGASFGINPPSYWLEHGKPNYQASLVVDPPDGRTPPLTAEALKLAAAAGRPQGDTTTTRGKIRVSMTAASPAA
jgi:hypothetical protein